jgi:hypothetical protein
LFTEPFATKKLLMGLYAAGIQVRVFTTDRSSLIKKLFK